MGSAVQMDIFELMKYIYGMAGWDVRALRTSRMKTVIQEAAGIRYKEGAGFFIMLLPLPSKEALHC